MHSAMLVTADLVAQGHKFKDVVMAFAIGILILFLVGKVARDDHRGAWSAVPIVLVVLILASAGGARALRDGGLAVWHLVFG